MFGAQGIARAPLLIESGSPPPSPVCAVISAFERFDASLRLLANYVLYCNSREAYIYIYIYIYAGGRLDCKIYERIYDRADIGPLIMSRRIRLCLLNSEYISIARIHTCLSRRFIYLS